MDKKRGIEDGTITPKMGSSRQGSVESSPVQSTGVSKRTTLDESPVVNDTGDGIVVSP
jgi:hypothetical protein